VIEDLEVTTGETKLQSPPDASPGCDGRELSAIALSPQGQSSGCFVLADGHESLSAPIEDRFACR